MSEPEFERVLGEHEPLANGLFCSCQQEGMHGRAPLPTTWDAHLAAFLNAEVARCQCPEPADQARADMLREDVAALVDRGERRHDWPGYDSTRTYVLTADLRRILAKYPAERAEHAAEVERWRDKASEAGAAYGLANQRHHEELDRANRLERLADTLAERAVDLEDRARAAEATVARVRALPAKWDSNSRFRTAAAQLRAALDGERPELEDVCGVCGQPREVPGEGRFCGHCQDYEGTCSNDHCMTCGSDT